MIELILEIPMELKVIIGSGIIMGLLQYRKDKVWEKQQQENQRFIKYVLYFVTNEYNNYVYLYGLYNQILFE